MDPCRFLPESWFSEFSEFSDWAISSISWVDRWELGERLPELIREMALTWMVDIRFSIWGVEAEVLEMRVRGNN